MFIAALIGFLFGFVGSMPVAGPIAVLVFARGIENRFRSGFAIAMGGALAEGVYACLAFWGFSQLLARYSFILPASRAVAAGILIGLGVVFLRKKTVQKEAPKTREGFGGGFALGFTITALNPTLIATWSAASATLFSTGLVSFESHLAIPFGISAILGIVVWFGLLLYLVHRFRGRFSQHTLTKIIRVMGVFVIVIGLWFAVLFVRGLL
jgi:threonine/homoserine/homoserine lactone efflux protein